MIRFTQGNLLEAKTQALVNTVNTVGIMGKGIALMFKEHFAANFRLYASACKAKQVRVGKMFVTETSELNELNGPRWIINFPTKQHWRSPSQMKWIIEGLQDLRMFLVEHGVQSIAIPPLGAGNGGLNWAEVREHIQYALNDLNGIDVLVFEPTDEYQNVAKRSGVEKLTPARALIAELVRRYEILLGLGCSLLEIQKLAWFLDRAMIQFSVDHEILNLKFVAHKYGPYSKNLNHLINKLDGSYLHCDKRINDARPSDEIRFDWSRKEILSAYLQSEAKAYLPALELTAELIDGFETPFGMELLATVDWLLDIDKTEPTVSALREGLRQWRGGYEAGERKLRLFDDRVVGIALERLTQPVFVFA
jgi:O-acetyl-ADP-ribose deacetylase (regulator of RNase III)